MEQKTNLNFEFAFKHNQYLVKLVTENVLTMITDQ